MGQFGIITKARIVLEGNKPKTKVIHLLTAHYSSLLQDMQGLLLSQNKSDTHSSTTNNNTSYDTVQSFVLPNQMMFLENYVGTRGKLAVAICGKQYLYL